MRTMCLFLLIAMVELFMFWTISFIIHVPIGNVIPAALFWCSIWIVAGVITYFHMRHQRRH